MSKHRLLTIESKDGNDMTGSVGHRTVPEFRNGFGGSAGGFTGNLFELEAGDPVSQSWCLASSYSSESRGSSGYSGYGDAINHRLDVGIDLSMDQIDITSGIFDINDRLEAGIFTDAIGRRYSGRLHLPFAVGEITVLAGMLTEHVVVSEPAIAETVSVPQAFQLID